MNPTKEIEQPGSLGPVPAGATETGRAARQAALAILYYAAFQVLLPLIRVPALRLPGLVLVVLLVVLPTIAFMFLQVRLAISIVRLELSRLTAALFGWMAIKLWWISILISPRMGLGHQVAIIAISLIRHTLQDVSITLACTCAGILLSYIVRDKNTLLPVAFIAMPIDYLGAMTPIGFTNTMLQHHPGIVNAVAVSVPKLSGPQGISLSPIGLIGPGDALFMAFYFAVVQRLSLNVKQTFWWMYCLLSASLIAVLCIPSFFALAALVPMGIAVIAANFSRFSLTRSEWFAFLYAGVLVLALAVGFYIYSHTQLVRGH